MNSLGRLLECAAANPRFADTANVASRVVKRLKGENLERELAKGRAQSSVEVAKIYNLRRNIGYFKNSLVYGLDETISSLASIDRLVHLLYIDLGSVLILAWVAEVSNEVSGLIIFEHSTTSAR